MSCTTQRRIDAQLEASDVTWGRAACRTIEFVADAVDSLVDEFIQIDGYNAEGVKTRYAIGKGADPEIAGTTYVSVTFATNDTAAVVAAAFKAAIDGISAGNFKTSISGAVLEVSNRFIGATSDSMGTSGFTYVLGLAGVRVELGKTSDAISIALEVSVLDITSNQTGGIVATQIFQGASASLSGSFIEINKERFDALVGSVAGDTVTPGGGTSVTGFGESKLFQALDVLGGQMILHPIRLPASDRSADYIFWKSAPLVNSISFDGTAPQGMEIEFNAYLDPSKDAKINLFARGDWSQAGLDA